jgi:hypothetical protein
MAEKQIPDRSTEPAVRESLDLEKSTTASNSNDVASDDSPETRDDEGNSVEAGQKVDDVPARRRPDSEAGSQ